MNLNALPQVRTTEDLRAVMADISKEPVSDDRLIWFTCVGYAEELSEATLKDLGMLFKDGVEKLGIDDVQLYIDSFFEGDQTSEYHEECNRYLLASVARFFGDRDLARAIIKIDDVIEHESC